MSITERRIGRLEERLEAESIQHGGRDPSELRQYEGNPLAFFATELGTAPWEDRQAEAVEVSASSRQTVIVGCHGAGKEWLIARLALYFAYARGMLVIVTSATEKQVLNQTWRELRSAFRHAPNLPGECLRSELRIGGEPRIHAFTYGTSIDRLTGWHDPMGVAVLISEGQGDDVDGGALDAAMACTTDSRSRIVVAGNPVRPSGTLYAIHKRPTWRLVRISAFDHPNVREGRELIPGGPAPDWPDRIAAEYGTDSPYYVSRVLAEFPDTAIDGLVQRAWIDEAVARHQSAESAGVARSAPHRLILDVARYGADACVMGRAQGNILRSFDSWRGASLTETADRVRREALSISNHFLDRDTRQTVTVIVDEIGVGGGVVDGLEGSAGVSVVPFNGASSAKRHDRFANRRAEAHWAVREGLRLGRWAIPDDPGLIEELMAVTWATNPTNGKIQIEPKDDIRSRLGRSPDHLDVFTMWAWHETHAGRVEVFDWRLI